MEVHHKEREIKSYPSQNASQFTLGPDELRTLLQNEKVVNTPISRVLPSNDGPRFIREVNVGETVGIDKFSGKNASTMTVVTDEYGNLVTTTPGLIK